MANYGVTFKDDGTTILVEAEFYEIRDGFLRFYRQADHGIEEFSAHDSGNIRNCVLQTKYTEEEIIKQIDDS